MVLFKESENWIENPITFIGLPDTGRCGEKECSVLTYSFTPAVVAKSSQMLAINLSGEKQYQHHFLHKMRSVGNCSAFSPF